MFFCWTPTNLRSAPLENLCGSLEWVFYRLVALFQTRDRQHQSAGKVNGDGKSTIHTLANLSVLQQRARGEQVHVV